MDYVPMKGWKNILINLLNIASIIGGAAAAAYLIVILWYGGKRAARCLNA